MSIVLMLPYRIRKKQRMLTHQMTKLFGELSYVYNFIVAERVITVLLHAYFLVRRLAWKRAFYQKTGTVFWLSKKRYCKNRLVCSICKKNHPTVLHTKEEVPASQLLSEHKDNSQQLSKKENIKVETNNVTVTTK